MASEGPNNPSSALDNDAEGNVSWLNPGNVFTSNNAYADTSGASTGGTIRWYKIILLVGGMETGANRADSAALSGSDTYKSFGGAADTWGLSLSAGDVNGSDFGVRIQVQDGGHTWSTSTFLDVTDFGFSVPSATIDGILVEIENRAESGVAYIDHVRITVYYTEGSESFTLTAEPGSFVVAGQDVDFGVSIMAGTGAFVVDGQGAELVTTQPSSGTINLLLLGCG